MAQGVFVSATEGGGRDDGVDGRRQRVWPRGQNGRGRQAGARDEGAQVESALERKALRRRLWWWRAGGLLLLGLIVYGAVAGASDPRTAPHVARISITGLILNDPERDALLRSLARDEQVKAVIIRIDSGGGSVVGGEALYEGIRGISENKPVVAVMGETGASAAYMAAIATDWVIARRNSLTASIGVLLQLPNVTGALESAGVQVKTYRSGALKALPSMFEEATPASDAHTDRMILEARDWFVDLVRERRNLGSAVIARISDGRVMSGQMALEAGLIDAIGGEADAVAWLESERGVEADLPVLDRGTGQSQGFLSRLVETFFGDASAVVKALDRPRLWSTLQ